MTKNHQDAAAETTLSYACLLTPQPLLLFLLFSLPSERGKALTAQEHFQMSMTQTQLLATLNLG